MIFAPKLESTGNIKISGVGRRVTKKRGGAELFDEVKFKKKRGALHGGPYMDPWNEPPPCPPTLRH